MRVRAAPIAPRRRMPRLCKRLVARTLVYGVEGLLLGLLAAVIGRSLS